MPRPQLNRKNQNEYSNYGESTWEQLRDIKNEVKDTRKELNAHMDKIEDGLKTTRQELNARMDRMEVRLDKQDEKIDKLADKIDVLHREIKSSTGHISMENILTVGIALAVICALLSK